MAIATKLVIDAVNKSIEVLSGSSIQGVIGVHVGAYDPSLVTIHLSLDEFRKYTSNMSVVTSQEGDNIQLTCTPVEGVSVFALEDSDGILSLMRYKAYIEDNLERVATGWVPVCFDEFVTSEEGGAK